MIPDQHETRLAIVIPAWRARHLAFALDSLRNQTDRRFRLYIGDDASPDDLRPLVETSTAGLDVVYHRFPENLGGTDLVGHWHRCIALTQGESWIWLFSDDDIANPDCVAAFYRLLEAGIEGATLLRFNVDIIDDGGALICRPEPHPAKETAIELLEIMLIGFPRFWCAPDHIFARAAYERTGGFVNLPKALYSDSATWVRFAAEGNVRTIPGARVQFRRHPQGTSSGMLHSFRDDFFGALIGWIEFAVTTARDLAPARLSRIRRLAQREFCRAVHLSPHKISYRQMLDLAQRCQRASDGSPWLFYPVVHLHVLRYHLRKFPRLKLISRLRYRHFLSKQKS
jgi:glycosyltransferase involved in cell wall biosynthesis